MVQNPRSDIWRYFDNVVKDGVAVCKLCNQRLKNERTVTLRNHIKNIHNPKSVVWKYYDNSRSTEGLAICKICSKNLRINRQFNLLLHLKTHGIVAVDESETGISSKNPDSNGSTREIEQDEETLDICMEKKTLVDAVLGLMLDEGVTPEIFASKNMQALLSPLCDAISSEQDKKFIVNEIQSEKMVHSASNYVREEFSNELQCRLLSLRFDMDINLDSETFHVIAQFIKDTQVEKYTLGEINLQGGEQLTEESIVKILHKYNIDSQQIVSAYWDDSKGKVKKLVTNAMYLEEMETFEKSSNIKLGDVKVERYIGVIGQLCIFDVLKSPSIFPLFMECRNLAKFINENADLFDATLKQNDAKIPQLDSPWKYGSTYTMMNDLMQNYLHLENVKFEEPECPEERFNCNEQLREFIEAFCKSFSLVQKSFERFYNSEMIFGDFYAQWLKCRLLTKNLFKASENGTISATISGELLGSIETRTTNLLSQDRFMACLYLDPRFQHTLTETQKASALLYLNKLWIRFKLYNFEFVDRFPATTGKKHQQPPEFDDEEDACLNEFLSQNFQEPTASTGIVKRLQDLKLPFQTAEVNVLSFWKELKFCEREIHRMVIICFAIPTTQNYNEANFPLECKKKQPSSIASNTNLTFTENMDLIRLNQHLLQKAMEKIDPFTEDNAPKVELMDDESAAQNDLTISVGSSPSISIVSSSPPSTSCGWIDSKPLTDNTK